MKKKGNKIQILMVVDNEFVGDTRVLNEAKALVSCGHNVKVLCLSFGGTPGLEEVQGIKVYRIRMKRKIKNIMFAFIGLLPLYHLFWYHKILEFARHNNLNVIHAHDLYMARSAGNAARKLGIPMVLDLHENYPEAIMHYRWATTFPGNLMARPHKWKNLEGEYLSKASLIITLSENFAKTLLNRHPSLESKKFMIYPNVPDIDEMLGYNIEKTVLPEDGRFYLFYFGVISHRRGIYTCLEALRKLTVDHSNITLVLAGPVDNHEKKDFYGAINSDDIKDNVIHIPWIDISLLPSYLNEVHVCISPILKNEQHESGVANKVFQYMLFGKPVLVSDCAPQSAVINEGRCGLVFQSNNAPDLADKIMKLYSDENTCHEMGQRGEELINEKYNLRNYGKRLCSSYKPLQG